MNPDFEEDIPGIKYLETVFKELLHEAEEADEKQDVINWYYMEQDLLYKREMMRVEMIEQEEREREMIFNSAVNLLKSLPPISRVG